MTIPAAPQENGGAGNKVLFLTGDDGALLAAFLLRGYNPTGSEVAEGFAGSGEMGVVVRTGKMLFKVITLPNGDLQRLSDYDGMADAECSTVKLQAPSTNTNPLYVGDAYNGGTAATAWSIAPGDSLPVPCRRLSEIYIQGTTDDVVVLLADSLTSEPI
jgi:hypothetical protein